MGIEVLAVETEWGERLHLYHSEGKPAIGKTLFFLIEGLMSYCSGNRNNYNQSYIDLDNQIGGILCNIAKPLIDSFYPVGIREDVYEVLKIHAPEELTAVEHSMIERMNQCWTDLDDLMECVDQLIYHIKKSNLPIEGDWHQTEYTMNDLEALQGTLKFFSDHRTFEKLKVRLPVG
jgi:hypothetical protein